MTPLTVGQLRQIIEDLPDETLVLPDWASGRTPTDDEPGVEILGFEVADGLAALPVDHPDQPPRFLAVRVGLFYLDEDDPNLDPDKEKEGQ